MVNVINAERIMIVSLRNLAWLARNAENAATCTHTHAPTSKNVWRVANALNVQRMLIAHLANHA